MTDFDEAVLTETMRRVRAWELLNEPTYCGRLSMGEFKELLLEAGYPEDVAQRAANERGWQRLLAGTTM